MRAIPSWIQISLILILLIISLNSLMIVKSESNIMNSQLFPLRTNEQDIDIHYIIQTGSHITISLNYDFDTTSQLGVNEFLSILIVFTYSEEDPLDNIDAAILFFHTETDEFLFFWMIGDPFHQSQMWQIGSEFEHFQVEKDLLIIDFIEFEEIIDQDIKLIVLGKILTNFEVNSQIVDFRIILDQFVSELNTGYEVVYEPVSRSSTTISTTTSTNGKVSSGFLIIYTISTILLISIILKRKRQRY